jgi:hypothetical protein
VAAGALTGPNKGPAQFQTDSGTSATRPNLSVGALAGVHPTILSGAQATRCVRLFSRRVQSSSVFRPEPGIAPGIARVKSLVAMSEALIVVC